VDGLLVPFIHVIAGGVLAKTLPSPVPVGDRTGLRGARIADGSLPGAVSLWLNSGAPATEVARR
jgi:hypothetical protein